MRSSLLVLCLIPIAFVSAEAGPLGLSPGPFAGVVSPSETDTHHYQNAPDGSICIQITQPYTILIESTGQVEVSVWGRHGAVVDGVGSFTMEAGVCASFDIHVTGQGDGDVAYSIQVTGNRAGDVLGSLGPTIVCGIC